MTRVSPVSASRMNISGASQPRSNSTTVRETIVSPDPRPSVTVKEALDGIVQNTSPLPTDRKVFWSKLLSSLGRG